MSEKKVYGIEDIVEGMKMDLREQIARIICCFAKDNNNCAECKENTLPNLRFPDCFADIRSGTDRILALIKEADYKDCSDCLYKQRYEPPKMYDSDSGRITSGWMP